MGYTVVMKGSWKRKWKLHESSHLYFLLLGKDWGIEYMNYFLDYYKGSSRGSCRNYLPG